MKHGMFCPDLIMIGRLVQHQNCDHHQHHHHKRYHHRHPHHLRIIRWTRDGGPLPVLDFDFKDLEGIKTILTPEVIVISIIIFIITTSITHSIMDIKCP